MRHRNAPGHFGDRAASAFSIGFYQALGAGRSAREAYDLGCVQMRLQGSADHEVPVLIEKTHGDETHLREESLL